MVVSFEKLGPRCGPVQWAGAGKDRSGQVLAEKFTNVHTIVTCFVKYAFNFIEREPLNRLFKERLLYILKNSKMHFAKISKNK